MEWKFTIIDRDYNHTEIDEPVGWDNTEIEIKRDDKFHGVFFDYQGNDFEFHGLATEIIKHEYEQYGIEGKLTLKIEQSCDGDLEELYRGRLLFARYDYVCGEECFVKIPIETTSDVLELRNRWDQKVNLQTAKAFDETTDLEPYDHLPTEVQLHSKGIFIQDYFKCDIDFETPVQGVPANDTTAPGNSEHGMIELGFDKQVASEIGNAGTNVQPIYTCANTTMGVLGCGLSLNSFNLPIPLGYSIRIAPLDISSIVNFQEGTANYNEISNPCTLDINISAKLINHNCIGLAAQFFLAVLPKNRTGELLSDYIILANDEKIPLSNSYTPPGIYSLNASYFNDNFTLEKGDMIYCCFPVFHNRLNAAIASGDPAFSIKMEAGSYFKLSNLSKTDPSPAKVFLMNEAISRISEAVTNDKIRAYSEYFGRTNSEPYSHAQNGPGSMEGITKGLFIRRQENRIADKPFTCNLSLKDMIDGLDPIHHIGFGTEEDTNREGYLRLRVEPWRYFYKNDVLMVCDHVDRINKKVESGEHYSSFAFGYQKWEAEEYTGLDEFLTKRKYRTTLSTVSNELTKLSSFIASGYALEITRRKSEDTKDWRYDNDTFIICLTNYIIGLHGMSATNEFSFGFFDELPSWLAVGATFNVTSVLNMSGVAVPGLVNTYTVLSSTYNPFTKTVFVTVSPGYDLGGAPAWAGGYFTITENNRLSVERGNVSSPVNIIDPESLYNYRISPVRNAMRWLDEVFKSYRSISGDAKIIFTDGDGNYHAEGMMTSAVNRIEDEVLTENETLDEFKFADQSKAHPLTRPERDRFDYPMSLKQFKAILANPYGIIQYNSNCLEGEGWIDSIKYKPELGLATFQIIPKWA